MSSHHPPECSRCSRPLPAAGPFGRSGICTACAGELGQSDWLLEQSSRAGLPLGDFGDFELLEILGRGSMGVVYRARQRSLKRQVALKLLRFAGIDTVDVAQRFQLEAEAAARLNHPNIVPIYEIGEHEGEFFFAMEHIDGGTLAQLTERRTLDPEHAASLLVSVAQAIHHAHERGVLHRDLKPGNILIDADGQAHIADFGLARLLEEDSTLTRTQSVLGSPAYMAPEQAAGDGREITTAADVYGLGAVLYHLLAGRPPFEADSLIPLITKVVESPPDRPVKSHGRTSSRIRDLETICLKCLEKDPRHRYPAASALAEDLQRWKSGEPIRARPAKAVERLSKWIRRKPVPAGLAAALILAVVGGLAGVAWQSRIASAKAREAQTRHYASNASQADAAIRRQDFRDAHALLESMKPLAGEKDLRGLEWGLLAKAGASDELATIGKVAQAEHERKQHVDLWFEDEGHVIVMGGTVGDSCLRRLSRTDGSSSDILPPGTMMWYRASYAPRARVAMGTIGNDDGMLVQLVSLDRPHETRTIPVPGQREATRYLDLCGNGERAVTVVRTVQGVKPQMHYYQLWDVRGEPIALGPEIPSPYSGYFGRRLGRAFG